MLSQLLLYFAAPPASCVKTFFGLPVWYRYLPDERFVNPAGEAVCEIYNFQPSDIPLIGLAVVDIALRIAALIAVGYVIYGGIQYVVSQGAPDATKKARQTIINALVGLVLAMLATGMVAFIGSRVG